MRNPRMDLGGDVVQRFQTLLNEVDNVPLPSAAVGLALGFRMAGLKSRVVAVRVVDRIVANRLAMAVLAARVATLLGRGGLAPKLRPPLLGNLEVRQGYFGLGYGHPTRAGLEAMRVFSEGQAMTLEATYTGKAAAAFLDEARTNKKPILFWNTYSSANINRWIEPEKG
jgi:1-aminocyclopropane-1-carboxylate deaminase/D-cysteine desulfhydrase-like pyridoxal-dependent ACC family enzyme